MLKYAESPQKVADSIMRARRAYAFAERRGFEDVWRSDALDMADLLTVNVNGNEVLDQQALMLLMTAIDRKVQESQTDSAAFWRNLYRSFADTARPHDGIGNLLRTLGILQQIGRTRVPAAFLPGYAIHHSVGNFLLFLLDSSRPFLVGGILYACSLGKILPHSAVSLPHILKLWRCV